MEGLSNNRHFNRVICISFCYVLRLRSLANWSSVLSAPYNGLIVDGNVTNYNYETAVAGNHTLVYNFWTISGSNARFTLGLVLSLYSNVKYQP